jgi:hypothetical protein
VTIPPAIWAKMPRAKRRLLNEGPAHHGHLSALMAASVLAAELRLQGASKAAALKMLLDGFNDGYHTGRKRRRTFEDAVKWAYKHDPPILTGCPSSSSHEKDSHKLRAVFAPYCDDACRAECRIMRAARVPEVALVGSPYEPLLLSTIWAVLGLAPQMVWRRMASLAAAEQKHGTVQASVRWLIANFNGTLSAYQVKRSHGLLVKHGLVRVVQHRSGKKQLVVFTAAQIANLEGRLQSNEKAKQRVADARREIDDRVIDWPEYALG